MRKMAQGDPGRIFRDAAGKALRSGPWTVTTHRPSGVDAKPNDYYSEGPYWWPDPKNPKAPYIRKDGERNPDRFQDNRRDLGAMCDAALSLGTAAWMFSDRKYGERLTLVLDTWFVSPKTRMNPHLEYGQAVRGHNTGRGSGLIDTVALIHCAVGVSLGAASGFVDASVAGAVRRWYADYLQWMTSSKKGLDEKKATNNHATWWTAQAAAYATFADVAAARAMAWDQFRNHLLPGQVQPDGSCPKEEARTLSLSYSSMNLDGFSTLCRLAELSGVDLWRYKTPAGIGIERAFRYLMPYVLAPATWKKQQIHGYEPDKPVFPALAGMGLRSPELLAGYRKLARAETVWIRLVDLLARSAS